jgi:hypothetical protein
MTQGAHNFVTGPLPNSDRRSNVNMLLIALGKSLVSGPVSNHRDPIDALARAAGMPLSFYTTPVDPSGHQGAINALIKVIDGD